MRNNVPIILCSALLAATAYADLIHLTRGGHLSGEVTGFADAAFQIKLTGETTTNLAAFAVRGVDFERGHATAALQIEPSGSVTGRLWMVDKQRFHIEGPDGATRYVPFASVKSATFTYTPEPAKPRPVSKPKSVPAPSRAEVKPAAAEPDIAVVARGDRVNITQQLVSGKVTVVDFYADWCAPCRQLAPLLERIASEDSDIAIRKVDIVRWGSPVAAQYNINSVPLLQVYGADGKLVRTLAGVRERELQDAIARAKTTLQ